MKRKLLCLFLFPAFMVETHAQVTRLSNNTSYDWAVTVTNNLIILHSTRTKDLTVYDIAANSFTALNATVTVEDNYDFGVMGGKLYFAGRTAAQGIELWVSNGTVIGTTLVKDINSTGAADSEPMHGFIVCNNELYFTANDGSTGRELWKTDGTELGTVRVKDINLGPPDAFTTPGPVFAVLGNTLVFTAVTAADGNEPWKTDGSEPGTIQLKNIYTSPGVGSQASGFTQLGTDLIFTAYDGVNGQAVWKTDGTILGTSLVKDIDDSPVFPPPIFIPSIFGGFFKFQNELYFAANDLANGIELWKTNGTDPGTALVKDIDPGPSPNDGIPLITLAVIKGNKFFFPATTAATGRELWESDGTSPNTLLLKDIATGPDDGEVFTLPSFVGTGLFQGDKFFLTARTPAEGAEFYISDGTATGTTLLKDIGPGAADGFNIISVGFFYTTTKFFFVADNQANGPEPWQSDGTTIGTTLVQDINTNPVTAGSDVMFATVASNTLFFFGTDGDDPSFTDFFRVDGSLVSLPLHWVSVEARPSNNDVLVSWKTATEIQTDHFVVQRSIDGNNYFDIGQVNANGGLTNSYQFTDANAMKQAGTRKLFYRVKYVDRDGRSEISRIVSVALNEFTILVRLVPNPVKDELKLVINAEKNDHAVLRCMNMEGKTVWQRTMDIRSGANTVNSQVGNLPNGVYLLQLTTSESVITERFLIQR